MTRHADRVVELRQSDYDEMQDELCALRAALKEHAPYKEWCVDPLKCHGTGRCQRDPVCGN